jgi:hypothetical protein
MIEKKTAVDQIEITRSGVIQIRFGLLLIEDGQEIDCKWHRTSIEPDGDVDATMAAVNYHLTQMGKEIVGAEGLERIRAIAKVAHTPEVIAAHKKKKEQR